MFYELIFTISFGKFIVELRILYDMWICLFVTVVETEVQIKMNKLPVLVPLNLLT